MFIDYIFLRTPSYSHFIHAGLIMFNNKVVLFNKITLLKQIASKFDLHHAGKVCNVFNNNRITFISQQLKRYYATSSLTERSVSQILTLWLSIYKNILYLYFICLLFYLVHSYSFVHSYCGAKHIFATACTTILAKMTMWIPWSSVSLIALYPIELDVVFGRFPRMIFYLVLLSWSSAMNWYCTCLSCALLYHVALRLTVYRQKTKQFFFCFCPWTAGSCGRGSWAQCLRQCFALLLYSRTLHSCKICTDVFSFLSVESSLDHSFLFIGFISYKFPTLSLQAMLISFCRY